LWAAHKEGADIEHVSLAEHFPASGQVRHPEILRAKLLEADGLIVSGPVYFGDRGSLAESLIQFMASDPELKQAMRGRLYAGIAVGAKRNGGQETTLIYQLLDMVNLGLLAVGNDSDTTAQYGGTCHAGDVGAMHKDSYGLDTSIGTGRRMARVLKLMGPQQSLRDVPKTLFLILQDSNNIAVNAVARLVSLFGREQTATVVNVTGRRITRCLACDICPARVGRDEDYRCVINSEADSMRELHGSLLYHDLIVPVGVTTLGPGVESKYQVFLERTRYLRRADYIWSDVLMAPLVLEESGDCRSLSSRMVTSFIRHHTVMAKPMIGCLENGVVSNYRSLEEDFARTLGFAARLTAGRLAQAGKAAPMNRYNPVGYVLSADKEKEDERCKRRSGLGDARRERLIAEAGSRLARTANAKSPFLGCADESKNN